jgi:CrcB protein
MFTTLLQVALGGAIGASARYLTSVGTMRLMGPGFPWGTLVVNVVGSFLMGVLVVVLAHKDGGTRMAPFLMTGMLGGFTTFSAFSLDAMAIYERGQVGLAGFYVGASVLLSLGAIVLAMFLTRGFYQ